ncbi:MAG: hypothetical protein QXF12_02225 [Candidatus Aenigmatarchaeota archaeon]
MNLKSVEKVISVPGFINQNGDVFNKIFVPFLISDLSKFSLGNNIFIFFGSKGQGKSYFMKYYSNNLEAYGANNLIINRNHKHNIDRLLDKDDKSKKITMLFIDGIEHMLSDENQYNISTFEIIKSLSMESDFPIVIVVRDLNKISNYISSFVSIDFDLIDFVDVFDIVSHMTKNIEIYNISNREDALYFVSENLYNKYRTRFEIVNILRKILNISYEQFVYDNKDINNPSLKIDYYTIKSILSK